MKPSIRSCEKCGKDFRSRQAGDGRMTKFCSRGCWAESCRLNGWPATTHGESRSLLHWRWQSMIARCENEKNKAFKNYGGRGIKVCPEWMASFSAFREWALANGYREDLEIDRRDNDGNYCPGNCRFVTRSVNDQNKRSSKKFRGVFVACRGKKFKATVVKSYIKHSGPPRETASEAAADYDLLAKQLFGEFAKTNF
jgi:hypothetical protein